MARNTRLGRREKKKGSWDGESHSPVDPLLIFWYTGDI